MKRSLLLLLLISGALLSGAEKVDPALLFKVTFDGYSTDADFAKGKKQAQNGNQFELNLRMFQGVNGKGNALAMDKSEQLQWNAVKNVDPRQGTVSLWLSPVNWQVAAKSEHRFLQIFTNDFHLQLRRDKNSDERIVLYIHSPKISGSKKAYYATAHIDPAKWSKNSWHKVDITWDARGMKLYIDGILQQARRNMITKVDSGTRIGPVYPETAFPPETFFPDQVKYGIIRLGAKLKVNPEERTAYDALEIRNRVMGASEIMQEYRKVMPEKKKNDAVQRLSVPAGEKFTTVPILNPAGDSQSMRTVSLAGIAYASIRHDNSNICINFTSPEAALRKNHTERDANVWEDDSFEVHFKNPAGNTVYQFIVNANGAIRDARNSRKDWNSQASAQVKESPDTKLWSVLLTIPMSDLGMKPGETWEGNFGMTVHRNQTGFFAWSGKFFRAHGKFFISKSADAVQITSLGTLPAGDLQFTISGDVPVKAEISGSNGLSDGFSDFSKNGTLEQKLETGDYTVKAVSQDGKFVFEHDFLVSNPFEISLQCLPQQQKLNAVIDLTNSGKRQNSGLVKFITPDGKSMAEKHFRTSEAVATVTLPLPQTMQPGNYLLQVTVDGINLIGKRNFIMPDLTPLKSSAGLDKKVAAPWTPVEVSGKTVSVWNRKFIFEQSPFPVQIYGGNKAVFKSAPQLLLNGQKVQWSDFKFTGKDEESVCFSGKGSAGNAEFLWQGEIFFDGLLKIDFTLEPADGKLNIDSFSMQSTVAPEFAGHVRAYNYTDGIYDWKNDAVNLKFSDQDCPFVWLMGVPDGIYFGFNSLANWVNAPKDPHLRIFRKADGVELNADVITKSAVLKGKAAYCWTIMPTPVRPMPANRRTLNWGSWRMPAGINLRGMGGTTIHNYLHWEDLTSLSSMIPRDPEAMKANLAADKSGLKRPIYAMPVHISSNDPEYDYLAASTAQLPSTSSHKWTKANKVVTNMPSCGHTEAGNMMAYRTEKLFQDMPMLYGIYFDIANAKTCRNTMHGHGGVDAFGQSFHTSTELPLRGFFLRIWKLAQKYDKQILLHVSAGKFTPVTHSYQHGFAPGEELYGPFAANPDYFYCEIPANRWQTLYNPEVYGTELFFLYQQRRSALGHPHLRHRQKAFLEEPEWTYRSLTPVILHDTNIWNDWANDNTVAKWWKIRTDIGLTHAVFTGYWNGCPVKSTSKDIRVSSYSWSTPMPYKTLLAVGNFSRKALPAGLELPEGDYTELWNNRKITAEELKTITIPGNHFLLIGIK